MKHENNEVVRIFWTGGWDSTFRLVQAILLEKRKVQPYYIIDSGRKSADAELKVMDSIKELMFLRYPVTKKLLLPTIIANISDIKPNKIITDTYKTVLKEQALGSQYDFLARFCWQESLDNVEMSVEASSTSSAGKLLNSYIIEVKEDNISYYQVDDSYEGTNAYILFRYYRFPILSITKLDIQKIVKKEGFDELMNLTLFCHNPRNQDSNYVPCGVCNPCIDVMKDSKV